MNFCQIDKYFEIKLLSGQTFLEHKKFDQNVPMFYILVVLQGLSGRLENVFDIVSGRYTVTIVVEVYTVTRPIHNNSHLASSSYVLHISLKVINTIHADTLLPGP